MRIALGVAWLVVRIAADRKQALDAARAERERLRTTLASIGDAVIATDAAHWKTGLILAEFPQPAGLTDWLKRRQARPQASVGAIKQYVLNDGKGLRVALTTLNTGRLTLPAACVGLAKRCLKVSREWAKERVQWGAPIGQHAAIADKIARQAAHTLAMESMTYRFEL